MKIKFAAIAIIFAWNAFAQDSVKTINLEEIAISAIRATEKTPIPQTTVSKKELDKINVGQHPIFLLEKMTPGFYTYSESGSSFAGYSSFRLRGINQERINITLNGVPLNDMIDQGVFFSNFTDISSNFESVQVQRGVGTSSNGVSSYGGSINLETVNLRNKEAWTEGSFGLGSFGTYRANFQHSTGVNKRGWGFITNFSKVKSNGYKRNTGTDAYSFFMSGGHYGDKDVLKLTAFTSRSENGLGYYVIDKSILDKDMKYNNLTANDHDDFTQYLMQLQYNRILSDELTFGVTGYYGGAGGDYLEGTPDSGDSIYVDNYYWQYPLSFFSINYPLQNDHLGTILNLDWNHGNLDFNTGIHAYTFLRENREEIMPDKANPYYKENSSKNEISWFAKANYAFNKFNLFADLQLRKAQLSISPDFAWIGIAPEDDITYDWTFFNPKAGINYQYNNNYSFYASYGRSGREPTKVDLFGGFQLNWDNYDAVKAGNNFKEEYVNDFEIGTRVRRKNISLDANYFYMKFENEIAPIGKQIAFGVLERRNIPNSTRSGVELVWNYQPVSDFEFSGNVAYLKTSISKLHIDSLEFSGRQHILSPDWIINGNVRYQFAEFVNAGFTGRYIGEQFMELSNDANFKVPSSLVADFSIEAIVKERVTFSLFVNNLFDTQYFTYGSPSDVDYSGTTEPGFLVKPRRNIFLSTRIRF